MIKKMLRVPTIFSLLVFLSLTVAGQKNFTFSGIEGEWQGTLEYANFTDDKRVKMKTVADIGTSENGDLLKIDLIYDDFGKIYRGSETSRIDRALGKYLVGDRRFDFVETDGKLTATGTLIENGKEEPVRLTIKYEGDRLEILKETRSPLRFRNRYLFTRSKHNTSRLRVFSPAELRADFEILKRALVELHPGLYRYNTPAEIEAKFKNVEAKLDKPLREDQFFKIFAQTISEVKCYHTYPNPIAQTEELKKGLFDRRNYFPFFFQIVGRRMIVTENASSKNLSRGSEITRINGVETGRILDQLLTATFADGKGTIDHRLQTLELSRYDRSPTIFDMIFPLFVPPKNKTYEIEAVDFSTKKKLKFEVLALTKNERSLEMERRYGKAPTYDDDWEFKIWEDGTAYLRMDNFLAWRLTFKVEPFLAKAFAEIRANKVRNLIIDIRRSTGGFDGVYREIFRYLAQKAFPCRFDTKYYFRSPKADPDLLKYASSWDPSFKENLAKGYPASMYRQADNGLYELLSNSNPCEPIKPYENNFTGKTFLLVSPNNSSAAFTLPYYAKQRKLATLVGQETGGNLRGFNGSIYLSFMLPNSGFKFDMSLLASVIDPEAEDSGVLPDILVTQRPEDVGNGFDRELETVKKIIAESKS